MKKKNLIKIKILVKNQNIRQKSKFTSQTIMFVSNQKVSSKIKILVKNQNISSRLTYLSKINILVKYFFSVYIIFICKILLF